MMPAQKRVCALAVLGAVVLLLFAGCAGEEHSKAYEQDLSRVLFEISDVVRKSGASGEIQTDQDAARVSRRIANGLRRVAAEADSIQAPSDVSDRHVFFVAELKRLADKFDAFAKSGGRNNAALGPQEYLLNGLERALSSIEEQGYELEWQP